MKINGRWVGYDEGRPPPRPIVWDDWGDDDVVGSDQEALLRVAKIGSLVALFLGSLLIGPWAFCTLSALVLTINVMKRSPGPTRRSERARLLADCDAQQAAWKRGDDRFAFFGQFPPPWKWQLGYVDGRPPIDERPPIQWNDGTPMPSWLLVGPAYENTAAVGHGA